MDESSCPMWDGYNKQCMWERMEKIDMHKLDTKAMDIEAAHRACLEDMP